MLQRYAHKFYQVHYISLHHLLTQWYKVYQDPEGTHSLEKIDHTDAANNQKVVTNGTNDNYYRSRITSLNEEIIDLNEKNKALNDELAMVGEY